MQGVQPTEKTIPKSNEEKNPSSFPASGLFIPLKILSLKTPSIIRPKNITISPVAMFTAVLYLVKKLPRVLAKAPRATKTRVKPSTKPNAFKSVFLLDFSLSEPAKYDTYIGSIGKKQGEIKVIIPSRKDTKNCIF